MNRALITGGAGFIGCNLAAHLARQNTQVTILDDLSRPGVESNLEWLQRTFGARIEARIADVRDREVLRAAVTGVDAVFHLAAQVAVTTSLVEPRHDFDVNARGTIEVLEAVRMQRRRPTVVFTSTNKVYGCLPDLPLTESPTRWESALAGIDEKRPLEFRTPYGCSKGCADQYVLDYAHSFDIPATVFRMSCIYGPHQFGTEDQGWVAHFLIRALEGKPLTIYGDGKQVRDILFVDDLVDAFMRASSRIVAVAGRAFNIGGGAANTISLRELMTTMQALRGRAPEAHYEGWRPGDQRWYVSDTTAFTEATGWRPRVSPQAGIETLNGWLVDTRGAQRQEVRHA